MFLVATNETKQVLNHYYYSDDVYLLFEINIVA